MFVVGFIIGNNLICLDCFLVNFFKYFCIFVYLIGFLFLGVEIVKVIFNFLFCFNCIVLVEFYKV